MVKKLYYLPGSFISMFKKPYEIIDSDIGIYSSHAEDCFFGYYDQSPISKDSEAIIYHRSTNNSEVEIIRSIGKNQEVVSTSSAWNFQQGTRLSWVNGRPGTLIFNSLYDGLLKATMIDEQGNQSFLNSPVAAISEDGRKIASCDYKVITELNPEYGYQLDIKNSSGFTQAVHGAIWIEDIENNCISASISLEKILSCNTRTSFHSSRHEINHLSFSPEGEKLAFVHRWYLPNGSRKSRLLSLCLKDESIEILMDDGMVSHYCWLNEASIFVYGTSILYGNHFYTLNLDSNTSALEFHNILEQYGDGHPSYNSRTGLIVFDSYPDWERYQHLYIYSMREQKVIEVGKFRSPIKFFGPNRCDLHPRWDRSGKQIAIDVCHAGHRDLMTITTKEWNKSWQK